MTKKPKILYVASTESHLRRFHQPYLAKLREMADVRTMATGKSVDFPILFDKHYFSFSNLRSVFQIRKILRREQFDAVLLHTTLAAFLVRAAMLFTRRRPYVLNVVHGYLFSRQVSGKKEKILLLCEKILRKKTDRIAVMNAEDQEIAQTQHLCNGSVSFLYGMGIEPFQPSKADLSLRASLGVDKDSLLCCFVGELSVRKNQIFLIRAVKKLCDQGLPIRLLLVGEGSEREHLEAEIAALSLENTVFLTGNREPVKPYLEISDLYVSASRSEGLPFNVMEAMLCGLPIVASATKGQTDLLEESPQFLYPLDDVDEFCRLVTQLYHAGTFGIGTHRYSSISKYLLNTVFEENMRALTHGWLSSEEQK